MTTIEVYFPAGRLATFSNIEDLQVKGLGGSAARTQTMLEIKFVTSEGKKITIGGNIVYEITEE